MKNLKFIDLFAGIGGFHLALKTLGMKCVFTSEIDEFARKLMLQILMKNIYQIPIYLLVIYGKLILKKFLISIFCVQVFLVNHFLKLVIKKDLKITKMVIYFFSIEEILKIKKPRVFFLKMLDI